MENLNINQIIKYDNIDLKKPRYLSSDVDWSRKQNNKFSKMHSISYYLAMFCPALPSYFINIYSNKDSIVMDNFSGRGTTALVCREKERKFIGSDLNPYAFILSKAKTLTSTKDKLIKIIDKLEKEFLNSKYKQIKINYRIASNKELSYFYSNYTLKQLLFLRENYGKNWKELNDELTIIFSFALGLMHGPTKKNNTTIYFSLSMPNTISMSPNYVFNYSKSKKLKKPQINIFDQLRNRINSKFDENLFKSEYDGKMFFQDATQPNKNIKNNSVDLVITSPPYLNIVNYTRSNWLKLWLLGYERETLKEKIRLSDTLKFDQYISFIKDYLNAIYYKLKNKAKVCLIVGDVFETNLIETVWRTIEKEVKYKFVEIYYDTKYLQAHKATNMLNSKKGKATKIDKVLVIEKNE